MHIITLPPTGVVAVYLWSQTVQHWTVFSLAHVHEFRTPVSVSEIPATTRETTGAEDHVKETA